MLTFWKQSYSREAAKTHSIALTIVYLTSQIHPENELLLFCSSMLYRFMCCTKRLILNSNLTISGNKNIITGVVSVERPNYRSIRYNYPPSKFAVVIRSAFVLRSAVYTQRNNGHESNLRRLTSPYALKVIPSHKNTRLSILIAVEAKDNP